MGWFFRFPPIDQTNQNNLAAIGLFLSIIISVFLLFVSQLTSIVNQNHILPNVSGSFMKNKFMFFDSMAAAVDNVLLHYFL
mgnify:FL=1